MEKNKDFYRKKSSFIKEVIRIKELVLMHENAEIKLGIWFILSALFTMMLYITSLILISGANPILFDVFVSLLIGLFWGLGTVLITDGSIRKKRLSKDVRDVMILIGNTEFEEDWEKVKIEVAKRNFIKEALLFHYKKHKHLGEWTFIDVKDVKTFVKGGEKNE